MSISKIAISVTLGVLITALILIAISEDSLDLKVEAIPTSLAQIVIVTNTGDQPITVHQITVNEREHCTNNPILRDLSIMFGGGIFPIKLEVGDTTRTASSCVVVRVLVETDRGSENFYFKN